MDTINIIQVALTVIIFTLKFSIGLNTNIRTITLSWSQIFRVFWMLLIIFLSAPVAAWILLQFMVLSQGALITIILLSATPGAPLSMIRVYKAGGSFKRAVLVQIIAVLISVFTVPLVLRFFYNELNLTIDVVWIDLMQRIFLYVVLPFIVGIAIRMLFPLKIANFAVKLSKISNMLLGICGIIILIYFRGTLINTSFQDYFIFILYVSIILVLAHIFSPPGRDSRTETSLLSISRHIGLAVFIVIPIFPLSAIVAYLLPYMVVNILVGIMYTRWRKNRKSRP